MKKKLALPSKKYSDIEYILNKYILRESIGEW